MPTSRKASEGRETAAHSATARGTGENPRKTGRRNKPPGTKTVGGKTWQQRFLEAFLLEGTITAAAEGVGVSRKTVFNERQRNEDFALAFADADEAVTEKLEKAMIDRALDGSDRLLEFALRARRPEKYSEQHRLIHSGEITSRTVLSEDQVAEELEAFGMPGAVAAAAGPEAVRPPEEP